MLNLVVFYVFYTGCAGNKVLEQRLSVIEGKYDFLQKEYLDMSIKIEETNNFVYVIQDKLFQQSKLIEELKAKNMSSVQQNLKPQQKEQLESPENLYKSSYDALLSGSVDVAKKGFVTFLSSYSHHSLADNAQYWLGECFYHQQDYHAAITEFGNILTNYSDGDKVCDAKLKIGYSYLQMGDIDNGMKYLKDILLNCKDLPVAKKAEDKLRIYGKN